MSKAIGLANELLGKYKNDITSLELLPSSGGVLEISKDGNVVFSKKEMGRDPEPGEIVGMM